MPVKSLQKILSSHFFKFSLIPIFIVEIMLIILYFSINAYISMQNTKLLLNDAEAHTQEVLKNESKVISDKLSEVSRLAKILQYEHQALFKNSQNYGLPNGKPTFETAPNGVFYKTNELGSSLYYSSQTKITQKELDKATFTEAMDINLKSIVDSNDNIVAAYFNSFDNMNRLYPFIPKVYEQYGEHINMADYNFYYLADLKHNPKKEPVWTGAYLDPAGNGWMLSCVVPIYNGDFLEGVTGIDITIDSFVNNILNRKMAYDAKLFMVDAEGMIIAMPEKIEALLGLKELKEHLYTDAILKTIEKPEEFNLLKNKSPFAEHFKDLILNDKTSSSLKINEIDYLTLKQNVAETNWKLMILIDKNKIFDSIQVLKDLSNKIGYFAIGFLILFYLVFFYLLLKKINIFSESFTKPIVQLSEQTSKIKEGKTEIKLSQTDVLELHQLNNNFTNMMRELNLKTKKLYESIAIAEELSKAKDEFLANMSHELKTPLNSIILISSILLKNRKGNLDGKDLDSLQVVNKSGNDLLVLINDVLDISKLEAGELRLRFVDIDTCKFALDIFHAFELQMKEKGLEFNIECSKDIGFIHSDEDRIKQILNNIIGNSLKFTSKGEISLSVKLDGEFIIFEVKDTGVGIPEDKLGTIFDRFKQVDSSTTRSFGGTGLGLSISKQLSELLGGNILVESEEKVGSKFVIMIKANKDLIDDSIMINDKPVNLKQKEKILVYNNDPVNFITFVVTLKRDYNVDNLSNFNELIYHIQKDNFKKIVVDASDIDMFDLFKLKTYGDRVIVVYPEDLSYKERIKEEFKYSYQKPFLQNELLEIVGE